MGNGNHSGEIIYKPERAYRDRTQPTKKAVSEKTTARTEPMPTPRMQPPKKAVFEKESARPEPMPVPPTPPRARSAGRVKKPVPISQPSVAGLQRIVIAVAVCLALVVTYICWALSPVQCTVRDLNAGRYPSAVRRYNEDIAGNKRREEKTRAEFESCILHLQLDFSDGKIPAETALEDLDSLRSLSSQPLADAAYGAAEDIQCILNGLDHETDGNYRDAMAQYMLLASEDPLFEMAAGALDRCVDRMIQTAQEGPLEVQTDLILETISVLQTDGRFPEQVLKLRDYAVELCRNHISQSAECGVPETGIRYVRRALELFPEDGQFTDLLTNAIGSYESHVTAMVELYIGDQEFAQAEELIRQAMDGPEALDSFRGLLTRIVKARTAFETELRTQADAAVAAKDFDKALSLVRPMLEKEPANALYQELQNTVLAAQETHITEQVNGFLAASEFLKAIELSEKMVAKYPGSTVYQALKEKSLSAYESSISARAKAYNADHDYASALSLLNEALEKYPQSAAFKKLKTETEQAKAAYEEARATFTNADVRFLRYTGSLSEQGEVDSYTFQASVTGYYRFSVHDMYSGFYVTVSVIDDATGETVERQTYMSNGDGVTAYLHSGKSYTAKVKYYSGSGSYLLKVCQAKATAKITGKSKVFDSIEFEGQQNRYTFTPAVSGYYRFGLQDVKSGFYLSLAIYDKLGYEVERLSYLSNNGGITAHLNKGEPYEVVAKYYSGTGSYRMEIGHQQPRTELRLGTAKTERISFADQRNYYDFTPSVSCDYVFAVSGIESGMYVSVYVYDSLDYRVTYNTGMSSGEKVTAKLTAGEKYTVVVRYYSGLGSYTLDASYK